jgi:hypothetical protein
VKWRQRWNIFPLSDSSSCLCKINFGNVFQTSLSTDVIHPEKIPDLERNPNLLGDPSQGVNSPIDAIFSWKFS